VPPTPADRVSARVDYFLTRAAFPKWPEGRHPHCHFRGLLRLHSYYGPSDRSAAQGDLCHEAPALPVTRPNRSSATRSIDNSLGGTLLHWCFAPSGRTAKSGHSGPGRKRPEQPRPLLGILANSLALHLRLQTAHVRRVGAHREQMPRDHGIIRLLAPYHASAVLPKSTTSMKSDWPLMSTAWSVQFCTDSRRNPGVVSPGKQLGKPHWRQGTRTPISLW
jgi:hypothetical protein